jgi:hypothetical protein
MNGMKRLAFLRTMGGEAVAADGSRRILSAPTMVPTALGGDRLLATLELSGLASRAWFFRV